MHPVLKLIQTRAQVTSVAGHTPLVLDSPHSGTVYPEDFRPVCDLATLRRAEDTHVEKLYAFAPAMGAAWIEAHFPRSYLDANREGQAWLLRFCEDHGVPFERRDAVTYAADERWLDAARAEHEAARHLGLDVRWQEELGVPFPHFGGTVLPGQAQLDAMAVLDALVRELQREGGTVVTGLRVVGVGLTDPSRVRLSDGSEVVATNVVLATGTPILDRGLYFAKVEPQRSYALAFRHPAPPELMTLSAGATTRSVRDVPTADGPRGCASTAHRSTRTWSSPHPAGQGGSAGISARRRGAGTAASPTSRASTACTPTRNPGR